MRFALALLLGLGAVTVAVAQSPLPMGDAAVRVEDGHLVAVALGLVPDGASSLAARRLSARSAARARATEMLHAYVDGVVERVSLSPRVVRDLHVAIDAHADLRRIRSRADGSAVVELIVPTSALAEVACASGLPWCG